MTNFDNPAAQANLLGLWDFRQCNETIDTGRADGVAQNGELNGNAFAAGDRLHLDGWGDHFDVNGADAPFDLSKGTVEVQFSQDCHVGSSPDTLVNRGEAADWQSEGFFSISVTANGAVQVMHCMPASAENPGGIDSILTTAPGLFTQGDVVNVVYSFDERTGATLEVQNLTTGATQTIQTKQAGLTLEIGDNDDENFTFGARESDDGHYDRFFDGKIDYVAVYDTDQVPGGNSPADPNFVVEGSSDADLINAAYTGDPEGDRVDAFDNDANPPNNDDVILAGAGDDTVEAGEGNDTVEGEDGNDSLDGGVGDDLVVGGAGNDTVLGGDGDDTLRGNVGNDLIQGGAGNDSIGGAEGNDTITGGAGSDSLTGGSGDDVLGGGAGNDTINGSSGNDAITDTDGANLIDAGIAGAPDRGVPFTGDADADPFDDRDTVTTGAGDDTISTGDDNDLVNAGDGDNVIDTGFDDDTITTGVGNDSIITGEGSDVVDAGAGDDTIFGGTGSGAFNLIDDNVDPSRNDPILDNADDSIDAGAGNDLVFGEDDNDTIDGGAGNDTLDGGIDDDILRGGAGDDSLTGGQGADLIEGGTGSDTITAGSFTDPIYGDTYIEGLGDTIIGGEDPDGADIDVLDLNGSTNFNIVFEDSIDPTGTSGESGQVIYFTDSSKTTVAGELTFVGIENVVPCFTPGAMIATPRGEVPVETLRTGDQIITRDNGIQDIRWVGMRTLNRGELARAQHLKPILIKAGALGGGLPERDMVVSPQHRVLVTGEAPQLYFDETEVLVAAKHLVGRQGISTLDTLRATYIHFMFDRHEVVLSDGAWTESFQPGDQTLGAMGDASRDEIFALFPELATPTGLADYSAARRALKSHEARLLHL